MSTQSPHQDRSAARDWSVVSEQSLTRLVAPVQFLGFWSAVLLPMALFPMLFSGVAGEHLAPFTALVVANVVALVVGRDYNSD
ncbi:hypothetical protein ACFR9U_07075 [Halorientalis brevis]|uniref:Uncharacterized protein n=1 Tax=Halorientalis brevis TaxID=1126241 RepID=A0ABD6CAK0_9EURY|nr:hypothetical protein [Halorientalis brevis]